MPTKTKATKTKSKATKPKTKTTRGKTKKSSPSKAKTTVAKPRAKKASAPKKAGPDKVSIERVRGSSMTDARAKELLSKIGDKSFCRCHQFRCHLRTGQTAQKVANAAKAYIRKHYPTLGKYLRVAYSKGDNHVTLIGDFFVSDEAGMKAPGHFYMPDVGTPYHTFRANMRATLSTIGAAIGCNPVTKVTNASERVDASKVKPIVG